LTDDTSAIQRAINSCPNGQVVYIPAGIYRLTSELRIEGRSIVLRGEGRRRTRLRSDAAGGNILSITAAGTASLSTGIVSGYTKDSAAITVDNASSLAVGDYVVVYQDNDSTIPVDPTGCGGTCNWCGLYDNSGHAMTQVVRITAKNGNTLTLNRPLYYTFKESLNPEVQKLPMMSGAGVEDLLMEMSQVGSGTRNAIQISGCANCWVRNVETYKIRNHHVSIRYSYGNEVRQCYFHHGWGNYPGDWAYGVMLYFVNSDHLIEDNIFHVLRHSMVLEGGGSGNVFAYNYSKDSQGNVGEHWMFPDMITHGAHPYMNLFEGNIVVQLNLDGYWGSSSHNTAFRNWVERRSSPPDDVISSGLFAVVIDAKNRNHNIIGNILCHPGCTGVYERASSTNMEIWRLGYPCPGGSIPGDPAVATSLIRHGNFDYVTNTTVWDPNIADRNLPASYYLASKPAFFGSLPWPAIGPDLTPMVGQLPAKVRFDAMTDRIPPPDPSLQTPPVAPAGSQGGCFIAGAAFGSSVGPHVDVLRAFRSRYLENGRIGRTVVRIYDDYSPGIAEFISKNRAARTLVRWSLLPVVGLCKFTLHFGIKMTLISILALLAGMITLVFYGRRAIARRTRQNLFRSSRGFL
jgi:hypothetical protein